MFQRTSGRMGRERGVAVFSPFLILSFLTVSVNITIGVACGEGYSGGRGGCFCPWEVWRGFAVATVLCMHDFWEIIDKPRQNCLNKCFCIKCKTKLHISFVAFAALFWNYQIMVTFLHRAFQLFVCVCCFFSCSEVCLLDDDNDDESSSSFRSTKCLSDGNRNPNVWASTLYY